MDGWIRYPPNTHTQFPPNNMVDGIFVWRWCEKVFGSYLEKGSKATFLHIGGDR
jgi:hypothetical protein